MKTKKVLLYRAIIHGDRLYRNRGAYLGEVSVWSTVHLHHLPGAASLPVQVANRPYVCESKYPAKNLPSASNVSSLYRPQKDYHGRGLHLLSRDVTFVNEILLPILMLASIDSP